MASFTLSGVTQTEAFRTVFPVHLIFSEKQSGVVHLFCFTRWLWLHCEDGLKGGGEPGRTVNLTAAVCRVTG